MSIEKNNGVSPEAREPFDVKAALRMLKSIESHVEYLEDGGLFLSIGLGEGVYASVDQNGLQLRLSMEMGKIHQWDKPCDNPSPEKIIEGLQQLVRLTPHIMEQGFERYRWGVDEEDGYDVEYRKTFDASNGEILQQEIQALVDFFLRKD